MGGRDAMRSRLIVTWLTLLTAGALALAPGPGQAAGESRLSVDYRPPRLSVIANDVDLLEVLGAIGAMVGFTVAGTRAPSPAVTLEIEGASVDDVLRQLLRTENHTILYRQGPDAPAVVDRIVLQGPPGERGVVASTAPAPAQDPGADRRPNAPVASAAPPTAVVAAPGSAPPTSADAATDDTVTVGDMLRSHAVAGVPPQQGAGAEPRTPTPPAGVEESLAIATRRAQQGVYVAGRRAREGDASTPAAVDDSTERALATGPQGADGARRAIRARAAGHLPGARSFPRRSTPPSARQRLVRTKAPRGTARSTGAPARRGRRCAHARAPRLLCTRCGTRPRLGGAPARD